MTTIHEVQFPNYSATILSGRRSLFHMPIDDYAWAIGDELRLVAARGYPRCLVGVLTEVRQVHLLAELDADLVKLCADRDAYLANWDKIQPDLPSADDPWVWRIAFRFASTSEWSLAT